MPFEHSQEEKSDRQIVPDQQKAPFRGQPDLALMLARRQPKIAPKTDNIDNIFI